MKIMGNTLDVRHVPFIHRWTHPYADRFLRFY